MQHLCTVLYLAVFVASVALHAQEGEDVLALPDWEQQEVHLSPLGGGLLPQRPAEGSGAGFGNIPGNIPVAPPVAEVVDRLEEVGRGFFDAHGAPTAFTPLLDPGAVLPEKDQERIRRMLLNHGLTARVSLRLILLSGQQRLPEHADLDHLGIASQEHEHDGAAGLSCLIVYPLGEPWRVRMFMSRAITQAAPAQDLAGLAQGCIKEALKTNQPTEQLEEFIHQLNIKLTWLERSYALPSSNELTPETAELVANTPTHVDRAADTVMEQVWRMIQPWLWKAGAAALALCVLWLAVRSVRSRLRRRTRVSVWILPDPHIQPRLGGKYCGGGGVSVRY